MNASSSAEVLLADVAEYLALLHKEAGLSTDVTIRLREIEAEVASRGTYAQTSEELAHGARLAWRNSVRCVGRKYWPSLCVRDCRSVQSAEGVFAALLEHLTLSTNGGKIVPLITVFAQAEPDGQGIRIWNDQLIRYAGYRKPDGTIVGDPSQAEFTDVLQGLGWPGGLGTPYDILPLVIQVPSKVPRLFEIPHSVILEVQISHPEYPWFAELGLRWHALPAIANMALEIGGIRYTAAPFSGWYMLTEIGARNFSDEGRYNLLPVIAEKLGLNTSSNRVLWRDRALVELNVAVFNSFRRAGVKIVDHHTVTQHFLDFESCEAKNGRPTYAEWSWIVPPLSGSTTPVFHRHYEGRELRPNFFSQPPAWRVGAPSASPCPMRSSVKSADQ